MPDKTGQQLYNNRVLQITGVILFSRYNTIISCILISKCFKAQIMKLQNLPTKVCMLKFYEIFLWLQPTKSSYTENKKSFGDLI